MARGIKPRLDAWENDLLARYYPHKTKQLGDKGVLQMGVRPIRLYELAFPEPALDEIMRIVQPEPIWNSKYQKYLWMLNKMLKLDKMPALPEATNTTTNFFHRDFVNVTGIGCKKDKYTDGIEMI